MISIGCISTLSSGYLNKFDKTVTENKSFIKEPKISMGFFSGQITDLNVWSIPLAAKELNLYASGATFTNILVAPFTKVLCLAFLYLQQVFVFIFWQKEIGKKIYL